MTSIHVSTAGAAAHFVPRAKAVSPIPMALGLALSLAVAATPAHGQRKTSITDRPAQTAPRPAVGFGTIDGIVTDTTLRPLNAADVSVVGVGARVVTSENGRFRILQVPPGQYLLVVRRIGYAPTSGIIQVPGDDTLRLSYTLARSENMLDTVRVRERRVSMRMLGFEQRRLQGQGQFITQEDLERRGSPAVKDALRNVRGLQVSELTNEQFAGAVALSRREGGSFNGGSSGACPMQIVLDGIILPGNFNLDLLPSPKQIAGIEVYAGPATIPPQFGGGDRRCGLVAVWTRDGY